MGWSVEACAVVLSPEGASEPEGTNLLDVGVLTGGTIFVTHCHRSVPRHNTGSHADAALAHNSQLTCRDSVLSQFSQPSRLSGRALSASAQVLSSSQTQMSLSCQ